MINKINGGWRYGVTGASDPENRPAAAKPGGVSRTEQAAKVDSIEIRGGRQEFSYSKAARKKSDPTDIAALKAEAEKATENLRRLVEQLILKQNKHYKNSVEDTAAPDAKDVEAARLAISEDGEFGVKAVSDRLVDFAISVSGGDKSKLEELISAIDAGFAAAKDALGGALPDICSRTYDETMRKLNEWAKSE